MRSLVIRPSIPIAWRSIPEFSLTDFFLVSTRLCPIPSKLFGDNEPPSDYVQSKLAEALDESCSFSRGTRDLTRAHVIGQSQGTIPYWGLIKPLAGPWTKTLLGRPRALPLRPILETQGYHEKPIANPSAMVCVATTNKSSSTSPTIEIIFREKAWKIERRHQRLRWLMNETHEGLSLKEKEIFAKSRKGRTISKSKRL